MNILAILSRFPVAFLFKIKRLFSSRKSLQILSSLDTVLLIKEKNLSVSRFGDGELKIMRGGSIGFQVYDEVLAKRLKEVIHSRLDNLLICVPRFLVDMTNITPNVRTFWQYSLLRNQSTWGSYLDEAKIYGDTQFTRFYMDLENKVNSTQMIEEIRRLWFNRDIIVVEGAESRLGVGNDLFAKAKSIRRIICPAENAFMHYEQILSLSLKYEKQCLYILALGPTATVLAYDLTQNGCQAIDIGHIDIEYEWFLRQSHSKVPIQGKYVNECHTRGSVVSDKNYESQIVEHIA